MNDTMQAIVRASQLRRAQDELDRAKESARIAYVILDQYHTEAAACAATVIMSIDTTKETIR